MFRKYGNCQGTTVDFDAIFDHDPKHVEFNEWSFLLHQEGLVPQEFVRDIQPVYLKHQVRSGRPIEATRGKRLVLKNDYECSLQGLTLVPEGDTRRVASVSAIAPGQSLPFRLLRTGNYLFKYQVTIKTLGDEPFLPVRVIESG